MEQIIYQLVEHCPNGARVIDYENSTREDVMRYASDCVSPYELYEIKQVSEAKPVYPVYNPFTHKCIGMSEGTDWRTVSKEIIKKKS